VIGDIWDERGLRWDGDGIEMGLRWD